MKKKENSLKSKRKIGASPLSCFPKLMYDPKSPLFVFFMVQLNLKVKVINQNQDIDDLKKKLIEKKKDILYLKEKIKEKGVLEESSSSRNPSFQPGQHQISSCLNKPHTDKIHVEKLQATHTRKTSSKHVTILKRLSSSTSSHT